MLVDTNTLLRTLQLRHPQYEAATYALEVLPQRGEQLHIVPQNLIELWVVATRPETQNGLRISTDAALAELKRIKGMFVLLPEVPAIFATWEALVARHRVEGKPAHDAKLVAAMQVHGLRSILTFDRSGFSSIPALK